MNAKLRCLNIGYTYRFLNGKEMRTVNWYNTYICWHGCFGRGRRCCWYSFAEEPIDYLILAWTSSHVTVARSNTTTSNSSHGPGSISVTNPGPVVLRLPPHPELCSLVPHCNRQTKAPPSLCTSTNIKDHVVYRDVKLQ